MRRALGRGLDALIRKNNDSEVSADSVASLPIGRITPNRYQPRKVFTQESLQELASSIKSHGLNQPIVVARRESGDYELISANAAGAPASWPGWTILKPLCATE